MDETSRSLRVRWPRLAIAAIGLPAALILGALILAALILAALYLVPLGDTANGILNRVPITVGVALATTVMAALVGAGLAPLAAFHGATLDRALYAVVLVGHIGPALWVALALSTTLLSNRPSAISVEYVPVIQSATGWLLSLALPLTALTLGTGASLARHLALSCRDRLESDLFRTLLSRGLPAGYIVRRHVLPRAFPESATLLALHFLGLVIGLLVVDAAAARQFGTQAGSITPGVSPVLAASALVAVLAAVAFLVIRGAAGIRRARGAL